MVFFQMTRYKNMCAIITGNSFDVLSSEKEFDVSGNISFQCPEGHVSVMSGASFINKSSPKKMSTLLSLCGKCNTHLNCLDKAHDIAEGLGFKIIKLYDDNLTVEYTCRCGSVNKSDVKNLSRKGRQPQCPKCQNDANKLSYSDIRDIFKKHDCKVLLEIDQYQNNKQLLPFRCSCGNTSEIRIQDIRRGRLCMACKGTRTKQTSIEKYGTDNPSKSDIIKDRIVQSNRDRHGVDYIMQSPEMFRKAQQSSFQRREYISPYNQVFNIMGYEDVFLDSFFKEHGNETEIYGGEDDRIPIIAYKFEGVSRKYYPDFFIPSLNQLVEIKSIYLYDKDHEQISAKGEAVKAMGYKYKLIVFKNRREIAFVQE